MIIALMRVFAENIFLISVTIIGVHKLPLGKPEMKQRVLAMLKDTL